MPVQDDKQQTGDLDEMSEELRRSLQLCHSIVDDYRSKLEAKSNKVKSRAGADDSQSGRD